MEVTKSSSSLSLKARLARLLPPGVLISRVHTCTPAVALTFDDGPHPQYTPEILTILAQYRAQATFFAVGTAAERYPELVKRIVAEGHTLGCHTQTHANLARLRPPRAWRECAQARAVLEKISGKPVRYLRPPWGALAPSTFPIALASRMKLILWSLDSLDYQGVTADQILQHLQERQPGPGEILLFHDDGANAVAALPRVLRYLQTQGLHCLSLDALLSSH